MNLIIKFYACFLAILIPLFIFSNFFEFLYLTLRSPIPPSTVIVAILLLSLPLALVKSPFRVLNQPYFIWFIGLTVMALVTTGGEILDPNLNPAGPRLLGTILLTITCFLVFDYSRQNHKLAGQAIAAITLLGCILAVYDLTHPGVMIPKDIPLSIAGRGAGFYVNPNASAFALLLGLLVSLAVIPEKYRWTAFIPAGIGILASLSRSNIVTFAAASFTIILAGQVKARHIVNIILSVGSAYLLLILIILPALTQNLDANVENVRTRLSLLQGSNTDVTSFGSEGRFDILNFAWQQFLHDPIIGIGYGGTQTWSMELSTHNMYMLFAVENGFLGFLLYPLMIYSVVAGTHPSKRTWRFPYVTTMVVSGFFSHNIATTYAIIVINCWVSLYLQYAETPTYQTALPPLPRFTKSQSWPVMSRPPAFPAAKASEP